MNKKILIFDDDQDILNICSIILKQKGYDVRTNITCNDLLEIIRDFDPAVILMDNKIPDIGGVEAIRLIKSNPGSTHIPVVLFSANTQIAELTIEAGADMHLQKPFDITDFELTLERLIDKRTQLNDQAV